MWSWLPADLTRNCRVSCYCPSSVLRRPVCSRRGQGARMRMLASVPRAALERLNMHNACQPGHTAWTHLSYGGGTLQTTRLGARTVQGMSNCAWPQCPEHAEAQSRTQILACSYGVDASRRKRRIRHDIVHARQSARDARASSERKMTGGINNIDLAHCSFEGLISLPRWRHNLRQSSSLDGICKYSTKSI